MEVFLLNVMGSAAVASATIVGMMVTRLSREMAGLADTRGAASVGECRERKRPDTLHR